MNRTGNILLGLIFALGTLPGSTAVSAADDGSQSRLVNGYRLYYGIVPAERMRNFAPGSEEAVAHARVPKRRHLRHLVVAVFDEETKARITDARVIARVSELGLGWVEKVLDPTELNGDTTYCAYFEIEDLEHTDFEFSVSR